MRPVGIAILALWLLACGGASAPSPAAPAVAVEEVTLDSPVVL